MPGEKTCAKAGLAARITPLANATKSTVQDRMLLLSPPIYAGFGDNCSRTLLTSLSSLIADAMSVPFDLSSFQRANRLFIRAAGLA